MTRAARDLMISKHRVGIVDGDRELTDLALLDGEADLVDGQADEITPGKGIRTRQEIAAWIRTSAQHTYHPACTARIGSPQDGAVDSELRVHGVERLRIADCSVMPTVTRGNTHAPTVMIGERCAEFIRRPAAGAYATESTPVTAGESR